jgi:hypothetical protein
VGGFTAFRWGDFMKVISFAQFKRHNLELLFFLTLLATTLNILLILWESFSMTHFGARVLPATPFASASVPPALRKINVMLLLSYTGLKEVSRWLDKKGKVAKQTAGDPDDEALIRLERGEEIAAFYVLLFIAEAFLAAIHFIPRLPSQLWELASQGLLIICSGRISIHAHPGETRSNEEIVLEHVEENEFISRGTCQDICGLDENHATRLLASIVSKGKLTRENNGKNTRYRLPQKAKKPATASEEPENPERN